jgi:hypothetical protein
VLGFFPVRGFALFVRPPVSAASGSLFLLEEFEFMCLAKLSENTDPITCQVNTEGKINEWEKLGAKRI